MIEAWELDGGTCASPFHLEIVKAYGLCHLGVIVKDIHHLLGRTSTGEFDLPEYLITLCRVEHMFCEGGMKRMGGHVEMTGVEYEYHILWRLRDCHNDRWAKPRELFETKIEPKRLKEIREIK